MKQTIDIPQQADFNSRDRNDILIWWLSQRACEAIGDEPPAGLPAYIAREYRSRLGRPGRGRLWADAIFGDVGVPWDKARPAAWLAEDCGGIVIWRLDVSYVIGLPGFVTNTRLYIWNSIEGPGEPTP